jgi:hypothetical protein
VSPVTGSILPDNGNQVDQDGLLKDLNHIRDLKDADSEQKDATADLAEFFEEGPLRWSDKANKEVKTRIYKICK